MQVIGVDVSKEKLHCAWLRDATRRQSRPKSVANTADGHAALLAWATRVSGVAAADLHVILEATGVYHEAAATFLHDAGCRVSVVKQAMLCDWGSRDGDFARDIQFRNLSA